MLFLYGKGTYPPSKLYTIDITSRAKDNTIMQERLRKQVVDSIKWAEEVHHHHILGREKEKLNITRYPKEISIIHAVNKLTLLCSWGDILFCKWVYTFESPSTVDTCFLLTNKQRYTKWYGIINSSSQHYCLPGHSEESLPLHTCLSLPLDFLP